MTVSCGFLKVIPLGLEPKTHSLEGCCSIQLSYGTPFLIFGCKGSEKSVNVQMFLEKYLYLCRNFCNNDMYSDEKN